MLYLVQFERIFFRFSFFDAHQNLEGRIRKFGFGFVEKFFAIFWRDFAEGLLKGTGWGKAFLLNPENSKYFTRKVWKFPYLLKRIKENRASKFTIRVPTFFDLVKNLRMVIQQFGNKFTVFHQLIIAHIKNYVIYGQHFWQAIKKSISD
jgi:hypothetical protein